jgi:undecaprenyl-diphosphatase
MLLLQLAVLAVVQGITEFLPISSSGHLIIIPALTGWPDQGLALDIAVHLGSIAAVMLYFRRELWLYARALLRLPYDGVTFEVKMVGYLAVATLPVVIVGFTLKGIIEQHLRLVEIIGITSILFGIVLYIVDQKCPRLKDFKAMTWSPALIIGLSQCLALIPGTSRSGITMTAARLLGYTRPDAARFSLLLSIPVTLGAGALLTRDVMKGEDVGSIADMLIGASLAFIASYLAIHYMIKWLQKYSFTPFVVYRIVLGVILLAYAYA